MNARGSSYWDSVVARQGSRGHENLWRAHLFQVYDRLFRLWLEGATGGLALKTDLYDEAISPHAVVPLLCGDRRRVLGLDFSPAVISLARKRIPRPHQIDCLAADVRQLPFRSGCLAVVLSLSTLDHFAREKDIDRSLAEIARVLKKGGTLIITLDNRSNPLIFLRNALSRQGCLRGIFPFFMGVTLTQRRLHRLLAINGFAVRETASIIHAPRLMGIWGGYLVERAGRRGCRIALLRFLRLCEELGRLPTAPLTGYYVAAKAVKL